MKFYYIFSKISEGFKFYEHMDSSDKGSEYNPGNGANLLI